MYNSKNYLYQLETIAGFDVDSVLLLDHKDRLV